MTPLKNRHNSEGLAYPAVEQPAHANELSAKAPAQLAYSVQQFCEAHGFTKVLFYKLLKEGRGPRIMKIGARTLISTEAAADWRREMEDGAQVSVRNGAAK
ncbi:hypothetical protein [Thauera sp.]|uniref:hypothetical protein n=1 Tax=Thauera sp. TaxID=1905334 RepID=UPI00258054F2|nr:hypothetical protein [Thauera sp.]